ncbi:peptidoglycan DD-metalloendopeptidase family protein [Halothiobacillus sp. DCM-1]|uniref:peptidoglycan DD-metalloendopeptidase family protein n=1 Tax=Halothiobacillus sp. DCM-1 TaxID=3112558 RepID=UPI00324BCCAC
MALSLGGCASSGSHFSQWDRASPQASAPSHRPPAGATHRVRPGDTLYSIAVAHNLDWRTLARWNGIRDPRDLRVGQVLRLSDPASARRSAPTASKAAAAEEGQRPRTARPAPVTPPPASVETAGAIRWQWPASGTVVSRFIDESKTQPGLIIRGDLGAPVYASAAGEVVYAGDGLPGYGNLLIVKHNADWLSAYGYNQSLRVKEGDRVTAGQEIATMGRRDNRSTAAAGSLLFQIRHNGEPVDPFPLLPAR